MDYEDLASAVRFSLKQIAKIEEWDSQTNIKILYKNLEFPVNSLITFMNYEDNGLVVVDLREFNWFSNLINNIGYDDLFLKMCLHNMINDFICDDELLNLLIVDDPVILYKSKDFITPLMLKSKLK